jgi:hypothetical protein
VNTFDDFQRMATTRKRKLDNNTQLIVRDDGAYGVQLHATQVAIHYADRVVLDSGGWQTVTTKDRMNKFTEARLWSERGVWFVSWRGQTVPYADGMTLHNDRRIDGAGTDPQATVKLRKAVNKYAKEYAEAFVRGEVPQPSGGDCWACCMVTAEGKAPMGGPDHIHSHLSDRYFVPSILNRQREHFAPFVAGVIGSIWRHEAVPESLVDLARERIQKAVRSFCFAELGLAK